MSRNPNFFLYSDLTRLPQSFHMGGSVSVRCRLFRVRSREFASIVHSQTAIGGQYMVTQTKIGAARGEESATVKGASRIQSWLHFLEGASNSCVIQSSNICSFLHNAQHGGMGQSTTGASGVPLVVVSAEPGAKSQL